APLLGDEDRQKLERLPRIRLTQPRPSAWGLTTRVMRYQGTSGGPVVWLGEIGAKDEDGEWYAHAAGEFVRAAAEHLWTDWSRPIQPRLALNVVGSGHGGFR